MNNFSDAKFSLGENVKVIKTEYSPIGRVMISKNNIASKQYLKAKKTIKRRIREVVRKIWRASIFYRLMFPDKFIFELPKIIASIKKIKEAGNQFDIIIVSAAPFSLLKLGRVLKKLYPGATSIYDTGDPFYGNTTLLLIKPLRTFFAKRFEKQYIKEFDLIVVPTQILKNHYIKHYSSSLVSSKIRVIEQGIEPLFTTIFPKINIEEDKLNLLYAGGLYKNLREPFELYKAVKVYNSHHIQLRIFGNIYKDFLPEPGERFYYGGSIGTEELLREYNDCNLTVFIDNLNGVQVPGKILELLSIKRPILFIFGNPNSPTLPFVKNENRVVLCENNSDSIVNALEFIRNNYNTFVYNELPRNYLWPHLANKYLEGYL